MAQTLLSGAESLARSARLRSEILEILADGVPRPLDPVLAEATGRCGMILNDGASTMSTMIHRGDLEANFTLGTVQIPELKE